MSISRDRSSVKKVMVNFTIDPCLKSEFIELTDDLGVNRSKLVALYIKKWVEKNKGNIFE